MSSTPGGPAVGRFAPSPTGPLHLGSLVAAVGSYLLARRTGGRWLLRIEDLDEPRVVPGAADDCFRTLEALGLEWDGAVVFQSHRRAAYQEALDRLLAHGHAYPCGCTRAEVVHASSAPHLDDGGPVYPGTCRGGLPAGREMRALRVRVEDEPIVFEDGIVGPVVRRLATSAGDFVVKRADGPFAYQLAVVVDDAAAGITQVARGSDLLTSTPRQIHLQRLLGLPTPRYLHLPLVTGPEGTKLSKRASAVSLAAGRNLRRDGGDLLLATLHFLGQEPPDELAGASPGSVLAWARQGFDPARVPCRAGPFPRPLQEP